MPSVKTIKKATAKRNAPMNVTFGAALKMAQGGKKLARAGWNGMFIIWVPGQKKVPLKAGSPYANAFPKRKFIDIEGHFDMYTAGRTMQPGWLASQADMVATDWVTVR